MKNIEIAEIFHQMAEYLEMDEISFRSRAYEKAARTLEAYDEDVAEIYKKGGRKELQKIPGIGEGLAKAIEDYLLKGRIRDYDELKKKCPVKLVELTAIEGLGPKLIKTLYKKLGVRNLKDLEKAAKAKKIRDLDGFGEKKEANILQGIEFVKRDKGRFFLGDILPQVRQIVEQLKSLKEVDKISYAGSIRRMKETIGDADILVTSQSPEKVMEFFVTLPSVEKVWAKGPTRSSVRLAQGFDCDLRVIKKESFGSALQYFTGNKYHNILVRRIAISKKLKLNEYGVFKKEKMISGANEAEVYQALGLPYIEPELRENSGEVEAALNNSLPQLIGYKDVKGDCHGHTNWSDGVLSIEQAAQAARQRGLQYMVITDHTKDLKIANGLDEKRLLQQVSQIKKVNQKLKNFQILTGCEVNIRADGSLDIKNEVLAQLDVVTASVHSSFKMTKEQMTRRFIRAMENPYMDIIGHLTGRILLQRPLYELDMEKIFKAALKYNKVFEINSHRRMDLSDTDIKKAVALGLKMVITTDSHSSENYDYLELGIATARRGWAKKSDILNTLTADKFLSYFNKK